MTEDITIRIPLGSGVAGKCAGGNFESHHVTSAAATAAKRSSPHVSELGQTLNIPDAYACKYFNKSGDKKTGGSCDSDAAAAAAAAQPM